jgi:hypothetical protein
MGVPMAFLAVLCVVAGVAPWLAAPALDGAVRAWAPAGAAAAPLRDLAPLAGVSLAAATLFLLAALFAVPLLRAWRRRPTAAAGTWDCGYARPTARMQYSASSFGRSLVALFGWALWPKETAPALRTLFPGASRASSVVPDAVLDRLVAPVFRILGRVLPWFRFLQQGRIHVYLLYFAMITLLLFLYGAGGRP